MAVGAWRRCVGGPGLVNTDPVIEDFKSKALIIDVERNLSGCRLSVADDVGERFPERGNQMAGSGVADENVNWSLNGDGNVDAESLGYFVADLENLTPERNPRPWCLSSESKDGRANLSDRGIEVVDRSADALADFFARIELLSGLQRESDGEEPLDHGVMEVASHPLPLLSERRSASLEAGAGFVDQESGDSPERVGQGLVGVAERAAVLFVAEVEIPVDRPTLKAHGDPEKACHRGVVLGEARSVRLRREIVDTQRDRLDDDSAQHSVACREPPDSRSLIGIEADRDEASKASSVLVEYSERPVPSPHQAGCLFGDYGQKLVEVSISFDEEDRVDQGLQLGGIADPLVGHSPTLLTAPCSRGCAGNGERGLLTSDVVHGKDHDLRITCPSAADRTPSEQHHGLGIPRRAFRWPGDLHPPQVEATSLRPIDLKSKDIASLCRLSFSNSFDGHEDLGVDDRDHDRPCGREAVHGQNQPPHLRSSKPGKALRPREHSARDPCLRRGLRTPVHSAYFISLSNCLMERSLLDGEVPSKGRMALFAPHVTTGLLARCTCRDSPDGETWAPRYLGGDLGCCGVTGGRHEKRCPRRTRRRGTCGDVGAHDEG